MVKIKVAIYCRVSTDDKGQDPKVQLEKCRSYCELHSHTIYAEFIDQGISGDSFYYDRPQGKLLYELINKNKIEGIVCFSIDRFSRQSPMKILPLLSSLKDRGILFISITESAFNMEGEFAEVIRYLIAWFGNYWLISHKKKVNAGIDKARKFGTKSGKPIGRKRIANYEEVLKLWNQGKSINSIAKQLGINNSSVYHAIHRSK